MQIEKSTHDDYRIDLFMPVMKEAGGKYIAVLSDNSIDRDDEFLTKECVELLGKDNGYVAALCNHNNDIFMQVAEWTNRGVREIDGYTALVAEPRFFLSNPNAQTIKGMLDDGAKMGISIGAIVKDYEDIDGRRAFKELELLEASFVAIPSNRHGRAMAVAKSFNRPEGKTMSETFTKEHLDTALEKSKTELTKSFEAKLAEKQIEISKLSEDLEQSKASVEKAVNDAKAELTKQLDVSNKKLEEVSKQLEEAKKVAIEKQNFADQGGEKESTNKELSDEDVSKAFSAGKIPVMRFN